MFFEDATEDAAELKKVVVMDALNEESKENLADALLAGKMVSQKEQNMVNPPFDNSTSIVFFKMR